MRLAVRNLLATCLALMTVTLLASHARADAHQNVDLGQILNEAAEETTATGERVARRLAPSVNCENITNQKVRERCDAANIAYYNYFEFGLEHRKGVFLWQDFSTRVIFAVVIALVLIGIWFAWLQFRRGMEEVAEKDRATHSVEIGSKGVKISSPVLGVIILALSLGFFYLYLVYVYPVVDTI